MKVRKTSRGSGLLALFGLVALGLAAGCQPQAAPDGDDAECEETQGDDCEEEGDDSEKKSDDGSDKPSQEPSEKSDQASEETAGDTPEEETPSQDPSKDPSDDSGDGPSKDPSKDPSTDPSKDPSKDPSEDPGDEPSEDPGEDPSEDPGEDPGNGRDCDKITWGTNTTLAKGAVVPLDPTKGYMDSDGDGKVETDKVVDVDMCQLHLSGKKCAIVTHGGPG